MRMMPRKAGTSAWVAVPNSGSRRRGRVGSKLLWPAITPSGAHPRACSPRGATIGSDMASIWDRVAGRTRSLFGEGLRAAGSPLAPGFYDQLEELLIAGDVGPALAARVTESVRERRPRTLEAAQEALAATLEAAMS